VSEVLVRWLNGDSEAEPVKQLYCIQPEGLWIVKRTVGALVVAPLTERQVFMCSVVPLERMFVVSWFLHA